MRLVVWNCWRGLSGDRWRLLEELKPDIAVLPEVEQHTEPPPGATEPTSMFWEGHYPKKGLGVFSFGEWTLEPTGESARVPWVLPLQVVGSTPFTLLAMWTVQRDGWPRYIDQVAQAIEAYHDELAAGTAVLAGDFNCSPQTAESGPHLENVRRLRELGMDNAFHMFNGLEHGEADPGTLYWRWQQDSPFHCDFAFMPTAWRDRIRSVEVGTFDDWVAAKTSDHVPVIVDLTP